VSAITSAAPDDVEVANSNTRIRGFVNRGFLCLTKIQCAAFARLQVRPTIGKYPLSGVTKR
jgi:hypothetical protein